MVSQWNLIIALSYPAKALGITRGMYIQEAKEKVPGLHIAHVDTITGDNKHHQYALDTHVVPNRQTEKVLLTFSRRSV